MHTLEQSLWELEQKFWLEGPDFHARHLTDDCVLLLPRPAGVLSKDSAIAWVRDTPRWTGVRFGGRRLLRLNDRTILLAYNASAHRRKELTTYRVLASSLYVNRDGDWHVAFHQETLDEVLSGATGRFETLKEP
ncbi:MAG: hypothetical protein OEW88_10925 [Gammaproteobacteria bacterium]|nr:hypothetical protein [Gammaproteobacteria bacterium]